MLKKRQLIGMAAKANRVEDLPYRVEQLLGSKKWGEMGGWRNPWAGPTRRNLSARSVVACGSFKSGAVTRMITNFVAVLF